MTGRGVRFTREDALSADGTRIGWLRAGGGPGLVLVQGAGADATAYRDLAADLSSAFTVIVPDRRGRGMSPKRYEPEHDIARDVEDLAAVLESTGATQVFGLSSGAMIALEAARTLPGVQRLAVFEPPFLPGGLPRDGLRRLDAQIERGDPAAALVTALRLSRTAPPLLTALPVPAAQALAAVLLAVDARLPGAGARQRDLLPGIRFDFHDVSSRDTAMDRFASIEQPVLLLSGTRSPGYLRRGVRELAVVLPRAQHVELHGLGHDGPWNRSRGGHPAEVAAVLGAFFAGGSPRPDDAGDRSADAETTS